jgi:hypothetical protein
MPSATTRAPFVLATPTPDPRDAPVVAPGIDHPSVGLDEAGIPLAAEGTLATYVKELDEGTKHEVVVFDLAQGERLSTFSIESPRYVRLESAGNRILAAFDGQLWSYALDGSDGLLLEHELPVHYVEPSQNGRYVAISGRGEWPLQSVAIIEIDTGERLVTLDLAAEFEDWKGEPAIQRWRSDEELFVTGVCNCDSGQPGYFGAIVSIEGAVERAPATLPSPASRRVERRDQFPPECQFIGYNGARSIALIDVATGAVLAEAHDTAPVFRSWELSPDGSELIVVSLEADREARAHLNAVLDSGECDPDGTGPPSAERVLSLLREGDTTLEPIESRLDVLSRWYDPLPIFECGGEQRAGWYAHADRESAQWVSPVGFADHLAFSSDRCRGSNVSVDMRIGAALVDTDAEAYRVFGFLQPR